MIAQKRLLRTIRRVTLMATVAGGVYLVMRFSVTTVPESRCSPLVRFEPGAQLIVDSRPRQLSTGDAVLVKDGQGGLHVTLIERQRADGALWCDTDREGCPGFSSELYGWVAPGAVAGRVILSWGS